MHRSQGQKAFWDNFVFCIHQLNLTAGDFASLPPRFCGPRVDLLQAGAPVLLAGAMASLALRIGKSPLPVFPGDVGT